MRVCPLILLCAALSGAAAAAQQPPPQRPLAQAQPGDLTPAEIQRLFDGMMVMDAQDALTLTDKQYPDFVTRLRALQETRRRNQQQRQRIMADLQRMTSPRNPDRVDDAVIKQRLAELQETESRSADELRKAYGAIDQVLDVRQQARFRVFEEQLERRRFELLQRARQNRQQQNRQQKQ